MPRGTLIFDGLWHCLCPSFGHTALRRPLLPLISRKRPSTYISATFTTSARRCDRSAANLNDNDGKPDSKALSGNESSGSRPAEQSHTNTQRNRQGGKQTRKHIPSSGVKFKRVKLKKRTRLAGVPKDIERRTTENLENTLQNVVHEKPSVESATQILRALIRDRHVRPEVRHYRALMLANIDAERGRPETIRNLLKEMERNGIPADSGTLHAALKVRSPYTCSRPVRGLTDLFVQYRLLQFTQTTYYVRRSFAPFETAGCP